MICAASYALLVRAHNLGAELRTPSKAGYLFVRQHREFIGLLGRFSSAYRVLFGESPSKTLRHPQEMIAVNLDRPSSLSVPRHPS
jgi:hypothetical protein